MKGSLLLPDSQTGITGFTTFHLAMTMKNPWQSVSGARPFYAHELWFRPFYAAFHIRKASFVSAKGQERFFVVFFGRTRYNRIGKTRRAEG